MFDAATTAVLRLVLDEVCDDKYGNIIKTRVATKLLEAAARGPVSLDDLRRTGRDALKGVPICC